jgi:hypothetical protein
MVATPNPKPNPITPMTAATASRPTSGSEAAATPWTPNTTATTATVPKRRCSPVAARRPVTDRMPKSPAVVAAKVGGCPQVISAATRWTVMTLMAAALAVKPIARSQNAGSDRTGWRSRGYRDGTPSRVFTGARMTSACRGTASRACSAARTSSAVRHPYASTSHPVRGRKMVLANPATTVSARMAFGLSRALCQAMMTANAAS